MRQIALAARIHEVLRPDAANAGIVEQIDRLKRAVARRARQKIRVQRDGQPIHSGRSVERDL